MTYLLLCSRQLERESKPRVDAPVSPGGTHDDRPSYRRLAKGAILLQDYPSFESLVDTEGNPYHVYQVAG